MAANAAQRSALSANSGAPPTRCATTWTPRLDEQFDAVTEGQEQEHKEKTKSKWTQLEALVGSQERIELVARDLVEHYEQR